MQKSLRKRLIGDKAFYRRLFVVAFPMLIQNGLTNSVSLLDNIMVGQTGQDQMSGVAIVNTLMMVFYVCIFGVVSGASIFGAQYYGSGNEKGFRGCFSFKMLYGLGTALASFLIFLFFGSNLIAGFLHEGSVSGNADVTLSYGLQYLHIMLVSLPVFVIVQAYASTLREMGRTVLPMNAGISAILINMVLNYILIFGKFGAPALGVQGAAIATVISRYAEALIIMVSVHRHTDRYPFARGIYRHFGVSGSLQKKILLKGSPLMVNEAFWSAGMAMQNRIFSMRGLAVIGAMNICSTLSNVFSVFFLSVGSSIGTIVGQQLGAGDMEAAKDTDTKLIFTSVSGCVVMAVLMAAVAPSFVSVYKAAPEVQEIAEKFILIQAFFIPFQGYMHACYFTLRSGGKTIVTLLFDSVYVWAVNLPAALALIKLTSLPVTVIYAAVLGAEITKCLLGGILLHRGVWLQNIVGDGAGEEI